MIDSLLRHEKEGCEVFVVCMDEISRLIMEKLNFSCVVLIGLHQIERHDPDFFATREDRTVVEYYWTSTPVICSFLLDQFKEIETLIYLDADLFFFSSPDPIYAEFQGRSILIHEHRFSPQLAHLEVNGKYNVGLVGFRNDTRGRAAVSWWRDRCIEWCYYRIEDGKLGDQLYLNDWPERFEGVRVLENPGAALAPWNHDQYVCQYSGNDMLVEGVPAIFYHFQSFQFLHPEVVVPAAHTVYPLTVDLLEFFFVPYYLALGKALKRVTSILPEFDFGLGSDDLDIDQRVIIGSSDAAAEMMPERIWQKLSGHIVYSPAPQLKAYQNSN